jgi:hypothetical protein
MSPLHAHDFIGTEASPPSIDEQTVRPCGQRIARADSSLHKS